jgi:hypothetical protein
MYWNNDINVEILPFLQYHIDARITEDTNEPWRLTCVYGEAQVTQRFKTWDMLKHIKSSNPLPWVCIGDFNEVLYQHEHVCVAERSMAQIGGFREMADVCELADLGFEGRSWTFEKKVAGGTFCRVRLDRALATASWSSMFPPASVTNLTGVTSDHGPILLRWYETASQRRDTNDRIFRYEVMWEGHENFKPFLEGAWAAEGKASSMGQLQEKLAKVSDSLDRCGRDTFGSVQREIRQLNSRLSVLRENPLRQGPSDEESTITRRLVELLEREKVMWRQ